MQKTVAAVVPTAEDHRSKLSSFPFIPGLFGGVGCRNLKRLGYTRSMFQLPLRAVRHPVRHPQQAWDIIGAMRTTSAIIVRNKSIPRGFAVDCQELASVSSATSDCGDTQYQSRSGSDVAIHVRSKSIPRGFAVDCQQLASVSSGSSDSGDIQYEFISEIDGEIQPHFVADDIDMNGRHMKVDILNVKDELASVSPSPVLRVKSGNRLARNFTEGSNEERRPLVRAQPKARRALTEAAGFVPPKRTNSFRDDVGHAAAETFLLTRLAFSLLRYLGVGYRWISKLLALGLYAMCLMPGFIQVGYQYFFNKNVVRSIVYGDQPRNRLDLYIPDDGSTHKPVVIFVTGGAWIIGYKAWGALLGLHLSERDVMVCCVDYRNFPQGGISDMVADVSTAIGYVVNNIEEFGGDPNSIYLAGQSAGSHIAACALIEQARIEIGQKEGIMTWKTGQIKAFMGLSGGYNLMTLVDHFHKRGLYKSIFLSIMEGETSLPLYSPELAVQSEAFAPGVALLPPMYLYHGTADYSIPHAASENFAAALQRVGATAFVKLYLDKTHTDVFLQDPMRGGHDRLWDDLLALLHEDDEEAKALDASAPLRPRLVPEILLRWAHIISPF